MKLIIDIPTEEYNDIVLQDVYRLKELGEHIRNGVLMEDATCEDYISRKMAIEAIEEIQPIDTAYDCTLYDEVDVMYILHSLPSVTPQQKWIPVSERLPKSLEDVLATDGVDMFVAFVREKTKGKYEWYSSDVNYDKNTPIEAWMPLPEPYKAEMEGDND